MSLPAAQRKEAESSRGGGGGSGGDVGGGSGSAGGRSMLLLLLLLLLLFLLLLLLLLLLFGVGEFDERELQFHKMTESGVTEHFDARLEMFHVLGVGLKDGLAGSRKLDGVAGA